MTDLVKILVNGTDIGFNTFETFQLTQSLSSFYNTCTVTGVVRQLIIDGKKRALVEVNNESEVQIYINDILQLTGYIWSATVNETSDGISYSLDIASKTKDLEESNGLPKTYKQRTLENLVRAVLDGNGFTDIKIDNQIGNIPITTKEDIVFEVGETILNFIGRYASQTQTTIITNAKGNLVFLNESDESSGVELYSLANGNTILNNVKNSTFSTIRRAKKLKLFAESDVNDFTKNSVLQTGEAIDELLSNNIQLIQQATTQSNNATLNDIAKYIMNRKRAESGKIPITVEGFRRKRDDKMPWGINTLVRYQNELQKIDSEFLITEVVFHKDEGGGTITDLVLCNRGTFTKDIKSATRRIAKSQQINKIYI